MELTAEQLEAVKQASREIEFGKITISFTGAAANIVDIVGEKHLRFHPKCIGPKTGKLEDRQKFGRMGNFRQG